MTTFSSSQEKINDTSCPNQTKIAYVCTLNMMLSSSNKENFIMTKRTYPTIDHVREVTQFKSKKQAEGAIEALKWLDQGAPHKFDGLKGYYQFAMDVFLIAVRELNDPPPSQDCGTACCIAGA